MKRIDRRTWLAGTAAAVAAGCSGRFWRRDEASVQATELSYGTLEGEDVRHYRLRNSNGVEVAITNYGAIVTHVRVPDREGVLADVVLGFDDLEGYRKGHPYFGCVAGRCANRIAGGRFELDGRAWQLPRNDGPNHLHGGVKGFDKHVWEAALSSSSEGASLTLGRLSKDGEEGYPGNLTATVVYTLRPTNELAVDFSAVTDQPTLCNLVQHSYWNLAGHDSGDVLDHELLLPCSRYTATDGALIPTGELAPVRGTPYDFTSIRTIGRDIETLKEEAGAGHGGGYDVNYAVDGAADSIGIVRTCATLFEPRSGRTLEVLSDQPGIQLYTGNFLDGTLRGKGGATYAQHQGLCLETQKFPDAIHHPAFPSVVLRPDEVYRHRMVLRFGTRRQGR